MPSSYLKSRIFLLVIVHVPEKHWHILHSTKNKAKPHAFLLGPSGCLNRVHFFKGQRSFPIPNSLHQLSKLLFRAFVSSLKYDNVRPVT